MGKVASTGTRSRPDRRWGSTWASTATATAALSRQGTGPQGRGADPGPTVHQGHQVDLGPGPAATDADDHDPSTDGQGVRARRGGSTPRPTPGPRRTDPSGSASSGPTGGRRPQSQHRLVRARPIAPTPPPRPRPRRRAAPRPSPPRRRRPSPGPARPWPVAHWVNRASWAVEKASGNPPASSQGSPSGTARAQRSSTAAISAWAPPPTTAMTRSPTAKRAARRPTATTSPATSRPGMSAGTPGGAG